MLMAVAVGCEIPNPAYRGAHPADDLGSTSDGGDGFDGQGQGFPFDATSDEVIAVSSDAAMPPDAGMQAPDASPSLPDAEPPPPDAEPPLPDAEPLLAEAGIPDAAASVDAPEPVLDVAPVPPDAPIAPPDVATPSPDTAPDVPAPGLLVGLVGYWPLDEGAGSTAYDRSGNANDGTVEEPDVTRVWRTGHRGGAAQFASAREHAIVVAPSASINGIAAQITVAAWIYRTGALDDRAVVSRQFMDGNAEQYDLAISNDAATMFMWNSPLQTHFHARSSVSAPMSAWVHLAATSDGTRTRVYQNGILRDENALAPTLVASSKRVFIGTNVNEGEDGRRETFDGLIDEVALWNRALSPSEIQTLANLPAPLIP